MLVPLSLLWNLQISLKQKLGLAGIFSLTVIIMVQSIIRVAVVGSGSLFDLTWSWTWGTIELAVGSLLSTSESYSLGELNRHSHHRCMPGVLPCSLHSSTEPQTSFIRNEIFSV